MISQKQLSLADIFEIPNHFYYTHNVKKSFKKRNPFFKKGTSFLQNA